MPNQPLIDALEAMRSAYAARQKNANALAAQVKAAQSAATKAAKSFADLAGVYADLPGSYQHAQRFLAEMDIKRGVVDVIAPDLKADTKRFTSAAGALKALVGALRSEPLEVPVLAKALATVEQLRLPDADLPALLNEAQRELNRVQQDLADTFGQQLRDVLNERGLSISGRGPFEIGRFELQTNLIKRTATLNYGKHPVIEKLPLSIPATLTALDKATALIMGRKEDGDLWMSQFYDAWEKARQIRGTAEKRVNVVDCYFQLVLLRQKKQFRAEPTKQAFVDYSRAQFAYDLYEFTQNQKRTAKGLRVYVHTAVKAQTDTPEKSLWVVEGNAPHSGRYIGDVVFDKDE